MSTSAPLVPIRLATTSCRPLRPSEASWIVSQQLQRGLSPEQAQAVAIDLLVKRDVMVEDDATDFVRELTSQWINILIEVMKRAMDPRDALRQFRGYYFAHGLSLV